MEFQNYWYLIILLLLAGVTLFLFIKKSIVFITEFKYMLPAIIFSGAIFVMLNKQFLKSDIISFNEEYLVGRNILTLPLEQWLFLIIISFFAFSVYILINERLVNFEKPWLFFGFSVAFLILFVFGAWQFRQKLIPFFIFFLSAIYLGYTLYRNRFRNHLTKFFISWFIVAIPFFLIRIFLNTLPVILYNNEQTLGIRVLNVPVEDFGFLFLLMLINITIFEYLRDNNLY